MTRSKVRQFASDAFSALSLGAALFLYLGVGSLLLLCAFGTVTR